VSAVARVLERLGADVKRTRTGWRAHCRAHRDPHPSLDLREGADGRALLICRGGCRTESVLASLALSWSDLFPDSRQPGRPIERSPLEQARHDSLCELRRQRARLDPWREIFLDSASVYELGRAAAEARALAMRLGPDSDDAWPLLKQAADAATSARALEAELDVEVAARWTTS
jgi:hypothetical protein